MQATAERGLRLALSNEVDLDKEAIFEVFRSGLTGPGPRCGHERHKFRFVAMNGVQALHVNPHGGARVLKERLALDPHGAS